MKLLSMNYSSVTCTQHKHTKSSNPGDGFCVIQEPDGFFVLI